MFSAPQPRYRIYTKLNSYGRVSKDLLFGKLEKDEGDIERFEVELASKFEVARAVCVPQGRVGIYFAIKGLIKPGQKVVLSPYTIADVINMVICAGGIPVFADTEPDTCNVDPNEVEKLIDKDTGAVMITHLHGLAAPAHQIKEICDKHGVPLVEDAAQAFGASENGVRLGAVGEVGAFSFGMYKNINAFYGGALISNNEQLIDSIKSELSEFSFQDSKKLLKRIKQGIVTDIATCPAVFKALTYWVFRYGCLNDVEWINRKVRTELDTSAKEEIPSNYLERLTPFQARIAASQLKFIDRDNQIRIARATKYHQGLEDIKELTLTPHRTDGSHIYTYFPVQYEKPMELVKWLMEHKRDVAMQHLKNCADLPGFSSFYRDCPNARKTAEEVILLPTYPRYPEKDVEKNIEAIRAFFS